MYRIKSIHHNSIILSLFKIWAYFLAIYSVWRCFSLALEQHAIRELNWISRGRIYDSEGHNSWRRPSKPAFQLINLLFFFCFSFIFGSRKRTFIFSTETIVVYLWFYCKEWHSSFRRFLPLFFVLSCLSFHTRMNTLSFQLWIIFKYVAISTIWTRSVQ